MSLLAAPVGTPGSDGPVAVQATTSAAEKPFERKLVFLNTYGLNWSILGGTPTGEVSLFLGSSLRSRRSRSGRPWRSALGYELTGSAGGADYYTAFYSWRGDFGVVFHRHHLSAVGYGAKNGRLFYQFGGGLLFWRTQPIAFDVDVRLGVMLGPASAALRGVVGGTTRIVSIIGGIPIPQFGVFAGMLLF